MISNNFSVSTQNKQDRFPLPVISEKDLNKITRHYDLKYIIPKYTSNLKKSYNSNNDYTSDDQFTTVILKSTNSTCSYSEESIQKLFSDLLKFDYRDIIVSSTNKFVTYCTMLCVYNHLISIKYSRKKSHPQALVNFEIEGSTYTIMNHVYSCGDNKNEYFCIVSEDERTLTSVLRHSVLLFFNNKTKVPTFLKNSKLVIKNEHASSEKFKYVKLPYFLIRSEQALDYPKIICSNEISTLEVSFYVTIYYKNMFEEIEKFIDENEEFPKLKLLVVELCYRIDKYTMDDLEMMVMKLMMYFENRYHFKIYFRCSFVYPAEFNNKLESDFELTDYRYVPLFVQSGIGGADKVISIYLCKKSKTSVLKKLHNYIFRNIFQFIGIINYSHVMRVPHFY